MGICRALYSVSVVFTVILEKRTISSSHSIQQHRDGAIPR